MPMVRSVVTRAALRPTRSPKCPKRTAPIGRAAKPTPNVANPARIPAVSLSYGKKTVPNDRAAAWL
jgi:hypothetical protein